MFLFLNILFEVILFQNCLLNISPVFRFIDEIVVIIIVVLCYLLITLRKNKKVLLKQEKRVILYFILFLFIGILANLIYKIQDESIAIYKDIFSLCKFIICYMLILLLSANINKERLLNFISKRAKIYINIIFIGGIINLFVDTIMSNDIRYGFRSYRFLYTHPTYLVSSVVILLAVIIAANKNNKVITVQCILILLMTIRSKAIVFICIYFIINILINYREYIKLKHIFFMSILGIIITFNKIIDTFSDYLYSARPALHIVGAKLALDYFPLGSGFGTFASSISGEYYSPIYYMYNISNVTGLTESYYGYMADSFWPYIYGQVGIFGLIFFILILILIYKSLIIRYRYNKMKIISATLIFIYMLIASTSEAIFIDVTGQCSFIILASYLGENSIDYMKVKKVIKR